MDFLGICHCNKEKRLGVDTNTDNDRNPMSYTFKKEREKKPPRTWIAPTLSTTHELQWRKKTEPDIYKLKEKALFEIFSLICNQKA